MALSSSIHEELLFRRVVFGSAERGFGPWVALGVSSLVFGLSHLGEPERPARGSVRFHNAGAHPPRPGSLSFDAPSPVPWTRPLVETPGLAPGGAIASGWRVTRRHRRGPDGSSPGSGTLARSGRSMLRVALALLAGGAWALVYPRDDAWATPVLLGCVGAWLGLVLLTRGAFRVHATELAAASVLAALVSHIGSALAWRWGVWIPELPPVLHRIFSTDGEASYNASDAQRFLVVLALLCLARILDHRVRVLRRADRAGPGR